MDKPKKRLSKAKIRTAKKHLRKLQKDHKWSLRKLAAKLGNGITFQSLGRFIREKDYVPASHEARELLDLYADPNPYRGMPRWWNRTPKALEYFLLKREQIKGMFDEAKKQRKAVTR